MPDIRVILEALSPEDKVLWSQHRTEMRRSYITAHSSILGTSAWDAHDDAFVDLIDIKLSFLFDRAGLLNTTKDIVGNEHKSIEENILKQDDKVKEQLARVVETKPYAPGYTTEDANKAEASQATELMRNDWSKIDPAMPIWPNGAKT